MIDGEAITREGEDDDDTVGLDVNRVGTDDRPL